MNLTLEFRAAMNAHLRLVETLGMDYPDTMRAMMLTMELAPEELKNEVADMAREMGLMPEADGHLDDGSPMFRLEDTAERLGGHQRKRRKPCTRGLPSGNPLPCRVLAS
jgi:hypothetical protein